MPNLTFKPYGEYGYIASGDYVFARWVGGGKHTGPALDNLVGYGPLPENSGKELWFSGMSIFTLKNGKIVKEIGEEGALTALQQLDLLPQPNLPRGDREAFFDVENM